ncbi:hypothetical protein WOLCODRAFT_160102 [Wolfiporia cocos MD-104 SS10]|uniref:Uncharacterized protein n=1 Tax=Wolfiporia cocos (strain MD-104) TaxID=742152 RepID=A0A2H3J421_WOLCO|nr:hypothetical protein WOLCODRAFT_160102 [Wolfiporia cocos MD-104 SS10]
MSLRGDCLQEEGADGMLDVGKWAVYNDLGEDLAAATDVPDARRSARTQPGFDLSRKPYMQWTNRKATDAS